MRRSRLTVLIALALLAAPLSAAALCAALACPDHAAAPGCHPAPAPSSRLSDCCAAPSPVDATAAASGEAAAPPRGAELAPSPAIDPAAAPALVGDTHVARRWAIPLFTLHRSLLL